ncbi:hypothetical protein [Photobacterium leiognathi]|uniref:Uncharacterized protein n=1 Tax=Photobacterium leiognathi subsp. mandapamensis TaxID=48408 RepID=A0A2T3KWM0_PHOLD|nr:hypothetical protein [Photobacterium leiognathi]PSV11802.1 hypothetical protein C0W93_07900 [Photobacterium leiognathi subsp. mandapamensis]
MSSQETRENETRGNLSQRVLALENSSNNRWEAWFGKRPGIVVGILIVTMFTGFWAYHTWHIERIDKKHKEELDRIAKEAESRILWLKEQHKLTASSDKEKCDIKISKIKSSIEEQCKLVRSQ